MTHQKAQYFYVNEFWKGVWGTLKTTRQDRKVMWNFFMNKFIKISFASPVSEDLRWQTIWMKEMLGYQVDEMATALRMPLSFKL